MGRSLGLDDGAVLSLALSVIAAIPTQLVLCLTQLVLFVDSSQTSIVLMLI